jgi:hypothetical protein
VDNGSPNPAKSFHNRFDVLKRDVSTPLKVRGNIVIAPDIDQHKRDLARLQSSPKYVMTNIGFADAHCPGYVIVSDIEFDAFHA